MSLADWMTPEFIRAFVSCYRNPRDARKFLYEVGVLVSVSPYVSRRAAKRRSLKGSLKTLPVLKRRAPRAD